MLHSQPIYCDDPDYYRQLLSEKKEYGQKEILFLAGVSRNKPAARKNYEYVALGKRPFNTIFLSTHEECKVQIGSKDIPLKANDLAVIPEYIMYRPSASFENWGYCIHFKTEYLLPFLTISGTEDIVPYALQDSKLVVSLTPEQAKAITILFEEIYKEYGGASKERDKIIRCYTEVLLLKCKEYFGADPLSIPPRVNRSFGLTKQFRTLVEKNFLTVRRVEDYAKILHISSKHLEKTIKDTLGVTPKQLIQDVVLAEAKTLLRQTDKTVSQIAYDLRFEDQSYFSRFFKAHSSITPHEYRDKV